MLCVCLVKPAFGANKDCLCAVLALPGVRLVVQAMQLLALTTIPPSPAAAPNYGAQVAQDFNILFLFSFRFIRSAFFRLYFASSRA